MSEGRALACLVTARHIIQKIRNLGVIEIHVRANMEDGSARWTSTNYSDWVFHPRKSNSDVAVLFNPPIDGTDQKSLVIDEIFLNQKVIDDEDIGVGTDVFITGLFRHHSGRSKNVPIVRVGSIAAMDDEEVQTDEVGKISAYLIEARSIGGLSGSPVFVHPGHTKVKDGSLMFREGKEFFLIGLIHGHYDVDETKIDHAGVKKLAQVNMGIAIVVPWYEILEVLDNHKLLSAVTEKKKQLLNEKFERKQIECLLEFSSNPIELGNTLDRLERETTIMIPASAMIQHAGLDQISSNPPPVNLPTSPETGMDAVSTLDLVQQQGSALS